MRASQLIKELEEAIEQYGDLEVADENADVIDHLTREYGMNNDYIGVKSWGDRNLMEV